MYIESPKCKKCGCHDVVRNGIRGVAQIYKCKNCNHSFTRNDGRKSSERRKKRVAAFFANERLEMTIQEISRMFNIKEKTAEKWIRIESEEFQCPEYKNKMMGFRMRNEYYLMVQHLLGKHDVSFEQDMINNHSDDYRSDIEDEKRKKRTAVFFAFYEFKLPIKEIAKIFNINKQSVERWIFAEAQTLSVAGKKSREEITISRKNNKYYRMVKRSLGLDDGDEEIENEVHESANESHENQKNGYSYDYVIQDGKYYERWTIRTKNGTREVMKEINEKRIKMMGLPDIESLTQSQKSHKTSQPNQEDTEVEENAPENPEQRIQNIEPKCHSDK